MEEPARKAPFQLTSETRPMLGKCDPQTSIFDGDQKYLGHVGDHSFYAYLAQHRHELFRDQDFTELYHAELGRPSVPPSLLCCALLLQAYDKCSDAEARDRAAYDQRWKVALGVSDLDKPFTKSTLQLFRAHLLLHEKGRLPFERSLEAARRSGYLRSHGRLRAVVDTTYILGRGAVRDTYNLIGDGICSVGRQLAKLGGQRLEEWASGHGLERYVGSSLKGESAVDWSNESEKRELLTTLSKDAELELELAARACKGLGREDRRRERLEQSCSVLREVLLEDVEPDPEDPEGGMRLHQGTSAERVCSVHDPEMRHGRKSSSVRFDGHKAQIAVDAESGLVAAVSVISGSAKDEEGSLEIAQEAGANTGLEVVQVLADAAYGGGSNRARFAEAGIELQAKVAKSPKGKFFSKEQFEIDLEAMTCRCPAGETTRRVRKSGWATDASGKRVQVYAFSFPSAVCNTCPLRTSCSGSQNTSHGRSIEVRPYEALLQQARAWERSPLFSDYRKRRQIVEHRIGRLLQLGVRQARFVGRVKTLFQVLMASTVANLTLVAGSLPGPGGGRQGLAATRRDRHQAVLRACSRVRSLLRSRARNLTTPVSAPHLPGDPFQNLRLRRPQTPVFRPGL